jgi:hypothetical protein
LYYSSQTWLQRTLCSKVHQTCWSNYMAILNCGCVEKWKVAHLHWFSQLECNNHKRPLPRRKCYMWNWAMKLLLFGWISRVSPNCDYSWRPPWDDLHHDWGPFIRLVMPSGLNNVPPTFQCSINLKFKDNLGDFMNSFLDDFSVFNYVTHTWTS